MSVDPADLELIADSKNLVVILGAGASIEAGLPSGEAIKRSILDSTDGALVGRSLGSHPQSASFFRVLSVYRAVMGDEYFWKFLDSVLKFDQTRRMQTVCYSYEILAHLLHHGAVKAIVSLNFDEVLDKAIELENGISTRANSNTAIASRSEFGKLLDEISGMDGLPTGLLLKPHGTISRRLTIRVTEDAVQRFEDEKAQVLRRFMQGADILTIGWRFGDPDIASILLNSARPTGHPIIVVTPHSGDEGDRLHGSRFREVDTTSQDFLSALMRFVEGRSERPTVSSAQSKKRTLQGEVGSLRHAIRSELFGGTEPIFQPTLARELAVEIAMHALKARGVFQAGVTFDCARIVCLAEPFAKFENRTVASVLQDLYTPTGERPVFMRDFDQAGEVVYWLNIAPENFEAIEDKNLPFRDKAEEALRVIADHTSRSLLAALKAWPGDTNHLELSKRVHQDRLADSFYALTSSFDVELESRPRDYAAFVDPKPIRTASELKLETLNVLQSLGDRGSSKLLISAATGEWLLRPSYEAELRPILDRRKVGFEIILDDPIQYANSPYSFVARMRIAEVKKAYPEATVRLATRKHHNLTAVVDAHGTFRSAIYFRRESKSPEISPVRLSAAADLAMLSRVWQFLVQSSDNRTKRFHFITKRFTRSSA